MSQDEITRTRFAATAARLAALGDSRVGRLRERLAAVLAPTGEEVALDAGTGTGPLALALAPLVREVIAVDLVPEMLEQGRQRAGDATNVRFVVGDVLALPADDGSVDLCASSRTLHHVERPDVAIAEMARVLRPGGRALVVDQVVCEDAREAEQYERMERLRDPSHVRTLPDSELRRLLFEAGLALEHGELEPEERDLGVFLDLAGCEGEQRAMVFAYVDELAGRGETMGVDLRRTPDGFRFTGAVGWYVARKPE